MSDEHQLQAQIYDLVYRDRLEDVEFYRRRTRRVVEDGGGRVLELGAGTGRVLLPAAGGAPEIDFVALEMDGNRLELLRRKAEAARIDNISLVCADMLSFGVERQLDLVTAPFRVLQYCQSTASLETVSRNVWEALRPGGAFVFDLFNPSIPALGGESSPATSAFDLGSTLVHRTVEVLERSLFDQTQHIEERYLLEFAGGGSSEYSYDYTTRFFFRDEVVLTLERLGFDVQRCDGDFRGTPFGFTPYPGELVFEARR